jgi:hypothetical protein
MARHKVKPLVDARELQQVTIVPEAVRVFGRFPIYPYSLSGKARILAAASGHALDCRGVGTFKKIAPPWWMRVLWVTIGVPTVRVVRCWQFLRRTRCPPSE